MNQFEIEVYTPKQLSIFARKASGETYEQIVTNEHLSGNKQLKTYLKWTLFGNSFVPGNNTGRMPLIGDVQAKVFAESMKEAADENNCVSTFEAITKLEEINGDYMWLNYWRAKQM